MQKMERGKDMRGTLMKKELIFGILFLLISTSVVSALSGHQTQDPAINHGLTAPTSSQTTTITIYIAEKTRLQKHTVTISVLDAETIAAQLQKLRTEYTEHPNDIKTQQLEQQFLNILYEKNVVPAGVTRQELQTLLQPPTHSYKPPVKHPLAQYNFDGTEYMCTFLSWGEGTSGPIIILPRLIPIIELPIPRIYMHWTATDYAVTSCGALNSEKGFTAEGPQKGTAIGFWGIGFTVHFPPMANMYGLIGYALYAHVSADYMEYYPPNRPPEITQTDPADGQQMVPMTTTKLQFSISDKDGDLMSYNVTTSPDIGSGSGGLKPDGVYSIPIQGLQDLTHYTWRITVTDGKDTVSKTLSFITEPVAPIISNVLPEDGDNAVPVDLSQLQFYLKDYQGDAMSYTVTTSPDIGSGSGTNIHDGTVTIPVHGLALASAYRWYVNVTDGTHWNRKVYRFQTSYPEVFNPFDYGWQYRKALTINHELIDESLSNFPVLVSISDNDLKQKAQADGSDILFMNATGVTHKSYFEIEEYQGSTGTLTAWVNIPTVSPNTDTTFYMYYGNPDALTIEEKEKTWDNNYLVVQHMHQDSVANFKDSTHYHNDIISQTGNPSYQQIGKIGYCVGFHGSEALSFASPIYNIAPATVEVWGKTETTSSDQYLFCNGGETSRSYGFYWYIQGGQFGTMMMNLPKWVGQDGITTAMPGQWYFCASTWDGTDSDGHFVINDQVFTKTSGTDNRNEPAKNAKIGQCSEGQFGFHGLIDEVRLSKVARDVGWLTTEYTNSINPTAFVMVGAEEGP